MLDKITKVARCITWVLSAVGTAISIVITVITLPKILKSYDSTYNSLKDNNSDG